MLECCRYIGIFEGAEWTGEKLLQVESDEPLEKLGMYIETDRKYMLLQLARVRDCQRVARRRLQAEDSGSFQTACPCLSRPPCSFVMTATTTVGVEMLPVSSSAEQDLRMWHSAGGSKKGAC